MRKPLISDHLYAFGELVIDRNLMCYIMQGLGCHYTSFVTFVKSILGALHNMLEIHNRMLQMQFNYETSHNFQAHITTDDNFSTNAYVASFSKRPITIKNTTPRIRNL